MPTLLHKEKLTANLYIGVQVGKGTVDIDNNGVWTARIKFPGQAAKFKTTRVKYGGGNSELKKQAIRIAYELLSPETETVARGGNIHSRNYATYLLDLFRDDITAKADDNDRFGETHEVLGGRGLWNRRRLVKALNQINYLYGFFKSLEPISASNGQSTARQIETITNKDFDKLDRWLQENQKQLNVESRLHVITELRHFLHWCYDKDYIKSVPSIKRPSRGGVRGARARMRREIEPDDYRRMIKHTRDKYLEESDIFEGYREYQYLFHLWILILANTGIRPPTSGQESTLIKWGHVDLSDKQTPILHRPDEKLHTYDAVIMPAAVIHFNSLRDFYENQRGMPCNDDDFVFRHTYDKVVRNTGKYLQAKGDPIYSFRKQWVNMVEALGLAEKGARQSERVSPSSLRAWFITSRLYADDKVDILQLARATGTSVSEIETRYARLDTKRSYEWLTAGGYNTEGEAIYETINGTKYYAGRK